MKLLKKIAPSLLILALCMMLLPLSAMGHSGRTDGSGGHRDNKNVSGLGYYHYHCGGYAAHLHSNGYCPYTAVFASSVKIHNATDTLYLGQAHQISATVSPENAVNKGITWASNHDAVVSVSANGTLSAKGIGSAVITASTDNHKKASFNHSSQRGFSKIY